MYGRTAKATATGTARLVLHFDDDQLLRAPPDEAGHGVGPLHGVAAGDAHRGLHHRRRPASDWRTAGSRLGRCHRSSAPIHQSSDQPPTQGVTRPRGSTIAVDGEARFPTAVQFRAVRLTGNGPGARGMYDGDSGSS